MVNFKKKDLIETLFHKLKIFLYIIFVNNIIKYIIKILGILKRKSSKMPAFSFNI